MIRHNSIGDTVGGAFTPITPISDTIYLCNMNFHKPFINSAEAAEFLNVSSRTIQRLRDEGKIRYYQDARIIRYKISDLIEYLENHVHETFN